MTRLSSKIGSVGSIGIVAFYAILIFYTSFMVSGTCLQDPDTCWLLSMGRQIFSTGAIPDKDPFSHTLKTAREKPSFVPYQWLSEITIYGTYRACEKMFFGSDYSANESVDLKSEIEKRTRQYYPEQKWKEKNFGLPDGAAIGLTSLTTVLVVLAFIVLPIFWTLQNSPKAFVYITPLIWLGVSSAWFHFYLRPEIFSYFFLAVLLCLTSSVRKQARQEKISIGEMKWFLIAVPVLTLIWANFHSGFVISIILLFTFVALELFKKLFIPDGNGALLKVLLVTLLLSLLASFINPFGIGLWQYLPHLFFAKSNMLIQELRPLALNELLGQSFFPFFLLTLSSLGYLLFSCIKSEASTRGAVLTAFGLTLLSIIVGISCRRLIPFCSLLIVFEILTLASIVVYKNLLSESFLSQTFSAINEKLLKWTGKRILFAGMLVVLALTTSIYQGKAFFPRIPQLCFGYTAPFDAIVHIEKNRPKGKLFNDPQYGDLLIWHLKPAPEVFIDTRFDVYGPNLVFDSWKIENTAENWKELLEQYKIGWIFVPKVTMLANKIKDEPGWVCKYEDEVAVIYERSTE